MRSSRKFPVLRITGLLLLLVFAGVTGIGAWFSHHYKKLIQARLPEISARATDSLYRISIEDLHINIFTRAVTISGVRILPDTAQLNRRIAQGRPPARIYQLLIPELVLEGMKWNRLELQKELGCRSILLKHPQLFLTLSTDPVTDSSQHPDTPALRRLYSGSIRITNPECRVVRGRLEQEELFRCSGGNLVAKEWNYRPGQSMDSSHFLFAAEAVIRLDHIQFPLPGSLYGVRIDTLNFESQARRLHLYGLHIGPSVSRDTFYARTGMQREIFTVQFPAVHLLGFAWGSLLEKQALIARELQVRAADIDVFFSRVPPPNTVNKLGNYPHQLLRQLSIPLVLPIVRLENCQVRYTEFNNKTMRPASIYFTQIKGTITNISNVPDDIARDPHCLVRVDGNFMDRGRIHATFDFLLSSQKGAFGLSANLARLDGAQLSDPARALALAEIKSLQLHQLALRISGDEDSSNGEFTILYDNLKIKLMKLDPTTLRIHNRPFVSFLANNLLLYNDNPMEGDTVRKAYTHERRDPVKPFFNLIWKNIFSAFVQTTVRNDGITDMVKRQRANKGRIKKPFFKNLFPKKSKSGR